MSPTGLARKRPPLCRVLAGMCGLNTKHKREANQTGYKRCHVFFQIVSLIRMSSPHLLSWWAMIQSVANCGLGLGLLLRISMHIGAILWAQVWGQLGLVGSLRTWCGTTKNSYHNLTLTPSFSATKTSKLDKRSTNSMKNTHPHFSKALMNAATESTNLTTPHSITLRFH